MDMFDIIKEQLGTTVPFAAHTGVEIESIGPGQARALLDQNDQTSNHIGSLHAGALFTLGEAASGAAMAGAFADCILEIRPVASRAEIRYTKVAQGRVLATAVTQTPAAELREALDETQKVSFLIDVSLSAEAGMECAHMVVEWNVRRPPKTD